MSIFYDSNDGSKSLLTGASKIGFKTGTQTALEALTTTEVGVFYLTNDTMRLYIGVDGNKLAPVNPGIITVDSISTLNSLSAPNGAFYYVTNGNILCVSVNGSWIQINANTVINSVAFSLSNITGGGVSVIHTIKDSDNKDHVSSFQIKSANNNATVSSTGSVVTVDVKDAPEYTLDKAAAVDATKPTKGAKVSLLKAGTAVANELQILPGDDYVTVTADDDGHIKLGLDASSITGETVTSGAFNMQNAAGMPLTLTKSSGKTVLIPFDPTITIGKNTQSTVHFANGNAILDVMSSDEVSAEIKAQLQGINALTYKGALASDSDTLAKKEADGVSIGDVWLQNYTGDASGGNGNYDAGTLWIAQGTEDPKTGLITGEITWVPVQNFNADTTYTFGSSLADNTLSLKATSHATSGASAAQTISDITAGTKLNIKAGTGANTFTIEHTGAAANKTTSTAVGDVSATGNVFSIPGGVITSITTDNTGHVTDYVTHDLAIPFTQSVVSKTVSVATTSGVTTATFNTTAQNKADGVISSSTASATVASESLTIEKNDTGININMTWGTF